MENLANEMVNNGEEIVEAVLEEVEVKDFTKVKSFALGCVAVAAGMVAYKVLKPRVKKFINGWNGEKDKTKTEKNDVEDVETE